MKIGVLASGSGSNLQSIIDSCQNGYIPDSEVALVISNKKDAFALERAKKYNISTMACELPTNALKFGKGITIKDIINDSVRKGYDNQLVSLFREAEVDIICLAGYLLVVTPVLLNAFPNSVINIHPSILPSFKGLHGVRDAYNYGTRYVGCTTHFVDAELDHGSIILQATTPVFPDDSLEEVVSRNLRREHLIFPETLRLLKEGALTINNRSVIITWDNEHLRFHEKLLELWRNDVNDYYNSRK